MGAKILASLISCAMLTFLVLVTMSFYIFEAQDERVCDICYDYAETISTKGELSEDVYLMFCDALSVYGNFTVDLKLETETEDGYRDIYYGYDSIADRDFKTGDILTIAVYGTDCTLTEKLTGRQVRCSAVKTAVIQ